MLLLACKEVCLFRHRLQPLLVLMRLLDQLMQRILSGKPADAEVCPKLDGVWLRLANQVNVAAVRCQKWLCQESLCRAFFLNRLTVAATWLGSCLRRTL